MKSENSRPVQGKNGVRSVPQFGFSCLRIFGVWLPGIFNLANNARMGHPAKMVRTPVPFLYCSELGRELESLALPL